MYVLRSTGVGRGGIKWNSVCIELRSTGVGRGGIKWNSVCIEWRSTGEGRGGIKWNTSVCIGVGRGGIKWCMSPEVVNIDMQQIVSCIL